MVTPTIDPAPRDRKRWEEPDHPVLLLFENHSRNTLFTAADAFQLLYDAAYYEIEWAHNHTEDGFANLYYFGLKAATAYAKNIWEHLKKEYPGDNKTINELLVTHLRTEGVRKLPHFVEEFHLFCLALLTEQWSFLALALQ